MPPLALISLALHGGLLFFPMPNGFSNAEEAEAEDPESEASEAVDLLSISTLATEQPEPEPELPPEAPPPEPAPSQRSPQPEAPARPAENPLQPTSPPEPAPARTPPSEAFTEPEPPVAAIDSQSQQTALQLTTRLTRGSGDSNFDVTDTLFPFAAWPADKNSNGISTWSRERRNCFFATISEDDYAPADQVADIRFLSRNIEFVENQDLPRTFPASDYQLNRLADGYCGHTFYEVYTSNGDPVLYVSVIGIGPGNPQSTVLVVFWSADPRMGAG